MKIWKQTVLSILLVVAAFAGWIYFYPGAGDVLARYGIDVFKVAAVDEGAGGAPAAGGPRPGGR